MFLLKRADNYSPVGKLRFVYYAFSDDGIDYSGSANFTSSLNGVTFDDFVHRSVSFESWQMDGKDLDDPKDLKYFLFTSDPNEKTLPQMSMTTTGSVNLSRRYYTEKMQKIVSSDGVDQRAQDVVVRIVKKNNKSLRDKKNKYLFDQQLKNGGEEK